MNFFFARFNQLKVPKKRIQLMTMSSSIFLSRNVMVCLFFLSFTFVHCQLYISNNTIVAVKEGTIFYQSSSKKDSSYSEKLNVTLDTVLLSSGKYLKTDRKDFHKIKKNIKSGDQTDKKISHSVYRKPEFKKVNKQILCHNRYLSILSGIDNFDAKAVVSSSLKVYLAFNRTHEKSKKFVHQKEQVYDKNNCFYRNNKIRFENFVRPPPSIVLCL
ncbi:hypothetical protein ACTS95_12985 [Empedobacter brevis]